MIRATGSATGRPRPGREWPGRWWPGRWWIATVVLLAIGVGLVTMGLRGNHDALADLPAADPAPFASAFAAVAAPWAPVAPEADRAPAVQVPPAGARSASAPLVPTVPRQQPVRLRIPAIGLDATVDALGLAPDRTVEVPTDFAKVGWFRPGPSPGQLGSAVVLGHVDSFRGPAVFFRLRFLKKGDDVEMTLTDGALVHFAVSEVAQYPKAEFPAQRVYGPHGGSTLQLVTCGGEFDEDARSYRSNVVVYTSLASTTGPPTGQN